MSNSSQIIRIGTRGSQLALWQANQASELIKKAFPERETEIVVIKTGGDKDLKTPLAALGGVGVFVKELERALVDNRIDVAVHSAKDMPVALDNNLTLVATLPRGPVEDVLLSNSNYLLANLRKSAVVGTSSPRRKAQLLKMRPDLQIKEIRGNVETRIRKVRSGEYDATVMARAGLERLGLTSEISQIFSPDEFIPAPAQGIVAIQARIADTELCQKLSEVGDAFSMARLWAERALLASLNAGCHVPLAALSNMSSDGSMNMKARIMSIDGQEFVESQVQIASQESPQLLGTRAARELLSKGGAKFLE